MEIEIGRNLKLRVLLAKSADILCAALCGIFAALGLLSLSARDFGCRGSGDVINTVAFAVFMLTTLFGIYGRPRLVTKAVFSLALAEAVFLFPSRFAGAFQILFYPLTMALLIFGARWKGSRFAALALTFALAFGISLRRSPEVQGEKPPESLYLPASLTAEQPGGLMLVFGDSSADELLRYMNYRKGWGHLNLVIPRTVLNLFRRGTDKYKVIIAGRSARFGGAGQRLKLIKPVFVRLRVTVRAAGVDRNEVNVHVRLRLTVQFNRAGYAFRLRNLRTATCDANGDK